MKNDFTIRNILKQWIAIWPVSAFVIICGIIGSILYANHLTTTYTSSFNVLIRNSDETVSSNDYVFLLNSNLIPDNAQNDDSCLIEAQASGNVLVINSTCTSSMENARSYLETTFLNLKNAIYDIYDKNNVNIVQLTDAKDEIENGNKVSRAAIIFVASILFSFVIAFIILDYKISKNEKKK